jgi:NTE family protein
VHHAAVIRSKSIVAPLCLALAGWVACVPAVAGALGALQAAAAADAPPTAGPQPAPLPPPATTGHVTASPQPGARPKIGLVLSGGGARGFAHIGVLRVLEELRVPVDIVTGTSMGSIIGGLYAAGYTSRQLEEVVQTTDWDSIFNKRAPRAELDWRRKEDDYKNLSDFELGIVDGGLTLPRGLAGTQRLEFFLRSLAGPSKRVRNLANLPVPFAAIATDLETGKRVLLQKDVSLSTAMRASMSVPGAFPPVDVHGRLLVDGGVVDNLPVDAARAMGADIIIAVNVGTPLLKREALTDVVGVAAQLTLMMGLETIERSIASLKPTDLLLTPALGELGSGDFAQGPALIAAGEAAARAALDRLGVFAVAPEAYTQREVQRTRFVREDGPVLIDEVRVAGTRSISPEAIAAQAQDLVGRELTAAQIAPTLDRIYSSGDFEAVSYSLVDEGSRSVLVITPYEKSWGYNAIRIGGNVQTNFNDDNSFNLLVAHSWRWLNRWGAEWRNEVQIGEVRRFLTEWHQPLGAGSHWFVLPRLESLRQERNLFVGSILLTRYENEQTTGELQFGRELPQLGSVRVGLARSRLTSKALVGFPFPPQTSTGNSVLLQLRTDTLDDVLFPRHGHFSDLRYRRYTEGVGVNQVREAMSFEALVPISLGRYTANFSLRGGTTEQQGRFQLGGLFNLTGTRTGEVSGDRGLLLRTLLFRNVSDVVDLKMPVYAGLSLESGDAVARGQNLRWRDFRHAAALFVGAESFLGPVFLAAGRTFGGDTGVYLYWGRPQ